jgi:GNAT superfamily N-acetyltransferase
MTITNLSTATRTKVDQIQQNLIAYFRLFAGLPGMTLVEDGPVTWFASQGLPGNLILRAQLSSATVDRQIDETMRQVGQHAAAIDWFVFPGCRPADLGERVAARGAAGGPDGAWRLVGEIGGPGGSWMFADLATLIAAPPAPTDFRIALVSNSQMLKEWARATIAGFGHDAAHLENLPGHAFYAAYARHGFGAEACSLHFVGYLDDQPVTSGTLLLAGGIAGLFDISTPPAFRRQGFGSAISWAMLNEAQMRGYRDAYVWSSRMGRNVYRSIGFVPTEIGMREYQWQKC